MVANPQHSEIPLINAFIGIIGAISAALAFLTIPSLKKFYTSEAVVLWYGVAMCLVGIVGMIVGDFVGIEQLGGFIFPSTLAWVLFILCGITGAIGQWLMTKSYMYAPPDIVAPIAYMRIVWSLIFGVLLGDSLPNIMPSIGISLILLSGVLVSIYALREKIQKKIRGNFYLLKNIGFCLFWFFTCEKKVPSLCEAYLLRFVWLGQNPHSYP